MFALGQIDYEMLLRTHEQYLRIQDPKILLKGISSCENFHNCFKFIKLNKWCHHLVNHNARFRIKNIFCSPFFFSACTPEHINDFFENCWSTL